MPAKTQKRRTKRKPPPRSRHPRLSPSRRSVRALASSQETYSPKWRRFVNPRSPSTPQTAPHRASPSGSSTGRITTRVCKPSGLPALRKSLSCSVTKLLLRLASNWRKPLRRNSSRLAQNSTIANIALLRQAASSYKQANAEVRQQSSVNTSAFPLD